MAGDDPDGVRVVAGSAKGRRLTVVYQTLALLLAGGCVGYAIMPRRVPPSPQSGSDASESARSLTAPRAASGAAPAAGATAAGADPGAVAGVPPGATAPGAVGSRRLTPRRMASHRPTKQEPEEEPSEIPIRRGDDGQEVTAGEYIQALHDAGIYTGIGAFNPPGTSPPLNGLAVPDDYQLPDGYVRHYQTTDDGQPIEPILMYSPDYEFLDADGNPIAIPDSRVVPPEQAPPGFPIRPIEMPPRREPGDLSR